MASVAFPELAKKVTLSDGTTYGYVYVPAKASKPTFLLLHGAPSSSHMWRNQIERLPKLGFGVLAPDLLGYGDTDKPRDYEAYRLTKYIVPQVAELTSTVVGGDKVIGVGHDWGSVLLSSLYVHNKGLFKALFWISVGYTALDQLFSVDAINAYAMQVLGYQTSGYMKVFVSEEGEALIEANPRASFSIMYPKDLELWKTHLGAEGGFKAYLEKGEPVELADYVTPEDVEMQQKIVQGSWYGVLNWYKAAILLPPSDADKNLSPEQRQIEVPTMLVITEKDYAIIPDMQIQSTQQAAGDLLQIERLPTGHWPMFEAKDEVEKMLEAFGDKIASQ